MSADLAAVMGTDLQSAVVQLGKALEDPEQGLQALRRVGVSFSDDQRNLIKAMVETGNQGAALTEIMRIMREQGFDKASQAIKGQGGLTAATDDLSKAWRDLLQTLGETSTVKDGVTESLRAIKTHLEDLKRLTETGSWIDRLILLTRPNSTVGETIRALRAMQMARDAAQNRPAAPPAAKGNPDASASAPRDPAIDQAYSCYQNGGKWENGKCVLPRSRTGRAGPKPVPYTDVFTGQEYSRAQLGQAAGGQLDGFSYITNDKATGILLFASILRWRSDLGWRRQRRLVYRVLCN